MLLKEGAQYSFAVKMEAAAKEFAMNARVKTLVGLAGIRSVDPSVYR